MTARPNHCPHCGALLTRPRSVQDHRRLFGLISKAYDNWPHAHPFQPHSAEQLRAYLLCEAGYSDATPVFVELDCFPETERAHAFQLVRLAVEAAIAAALAQGSYAFTRISADTITVFRPRSINFATLSQKDFGPIRDAVEGLIEAAVGVNADQLLKEEAA